MALLEGVIKLSGRFSGTSKLWMSPDDPPRECESTATVTPVAKGGFARIDYAWSFSGTPHEGTLLLGIDKARDEAIAAWCDSWHMSENLMVCKGTVSTNGRVSVTGSYAAPPGPDWGWRTEVEPRGDDALRLAMYNITPEGEEALAVEAIYARIS